MNARRLHVKLVPWLLLPLAVIFTTGALLQARHLLPFLQPPTATGSSREVSLPWPELLRAATSVPEAQIRSWNDIRQVDIRPKQGVIRVRNHQFYEIQIDSKTGAVLSHGMRYTSHLIAIHEGSFFSSLIEKSVFFPTSLLTLVLFFTGVVIYVQSHVRIRSRKPVAKSARRS